MRRLPGHCEDCACWDHEGGCWLHPLPIPTEPRHGCFQFRTRDVAMEERGTGELGEATSDGAADVPSGDSREPHEPRAEPREMDGMTIDELGLSSRAWNCLDTEDIVTIGQLVQRCEGQLLALRNLGRVSLHDIKEKLARKGLGLAAHPGPCGPWHCRKRAGMHRKGEAG